MHPRLNLPAWYAAPESDESGHLGCGGSSCSGAAGCFSAGALGSGCGSGVLRDRGVAKVPSISACPAVGVPVQPQRVMSM